jgi:S1-C subfamily serine protease
MFGQPSAGPFGKRGARRPASSFVARVVALAIVFFETSAVARPFWRLHDFLAPPSRALAETNVPHPAVARIIVPERDGTAFGSGTLVDVRDKYGLVVTNHHVVGHAAGPIEVVFPNGFRSLARSLRMDSEWDLAAIVIWRPENITPVKLSTRAPRPGDILTICGYGQGQYRSITGRCTDYYAPSIGQPLELVELDVEARQGDSGGPILNAQNELAGVLFGAGRGTTLGSFGGRVKGFLATVAPDIGAASNDVEVASVEAKSATDEGAKPQPAATGFAKWQPVKPAQQATKVTPAAAHESSLPPSQWFETYVPFATCAAVGALFFAFVRMVK